MNSKNISIGFLAALVLVTLFSLQRVNPNSSPALALQMGQATYTNASKDLITVESINVGDEVRSPLTVYGKARGPWYYENAFPILIHDENGVPVGRGIALAQGSTESDEFVPFKAIVTFESFGTKGSVLFVSNDNPSGNPGGIRTLSIPVSFEN
jgi:Immunoglobulin-like domain of bacterial spore germination